MSAAGCSQTAPGPGPGREAGPGRSRGPAGPEAAGTAGRCCLAPRGLRGSRAGPGSLGSYLQQINI